MSKLGLETRLGIDLGLPGRDRGAGTVLPTVSLRRGDVYFHTGWSCLLEYTGTAWRPLEKGSAATKAAIDQLTGMPVGLRMVAQDTGWTWEWTGTFWKITTPGAVVCSVYMNADRAAGSGMQMVYCQAARYDPLNAYNTTTGQFITPYTGLYRLSGVAAYTANASGSRGAIFRRTADGSYIDASAQIVAASSIQSVVATATIITSLTAGQSIYLAGYSSITGLSHLGSAAGQQCGATFELVEQTG